MHKADILKYAVVAAGMLVLPNIPALAAPEGQVVVAQGSDVPTLDATMDISAGGLNVLRNIFSQLTVIDVDGTVKPDLAKSWEASSDAKIWTFTMEPNAKFHDGKPVTADDVIWTLEKVKNDQRSPMRAYMNVFESMEKVGTDKVKIVLTKPFSAFDRHVSLLPIVSKESYEALGPEKFATQPVGSGPFKVVRWIKDDRIELEAVPNYWGGEPKIKTVIFRPVASEAARFAALQAGDVDVVAGLPPVVVERLKNRPGVKVETVNSNRVVYIGVNIGNPALDLKVRQAIDLVIDREAIAKNLLRGTGTPTSQILAPMTFGYDDTIKVTPRNLEKARQLVKESGYKGETIPLQYPNNRIALGNEVAQAVAGYLKEIGLNVELQGMEYPPFLALWLEKKLPGLFLFSYGPSIMDAELALSTLYETGSTRGYWTDPKIDELIARQRADTDPARRLDAIKQVWKLERDVLPYIPIYNEIHSYGVSDKVKWLPRPDERLLFIDAQVVKK